MRTAKSLDWITGTQLENPDGEIVKLVPDWTEIGNEIKPPPRFDRAYELKPAGTYALCATGTKCKLLQFTGSELTKVRETGVTDEQILQHCVKKCHNITRLDYAVDMFEVSFSPYDILELWDKGLLKTRLRTVRTNKTYTGYGGETVYFGSKNSAQQIRIYDKAAEQKLLNEAWIRVELQARKKKATPLASDMVNQGIVACGDTRLRDLMGMPDEYEIRKAIAGQDADLTKVPRQLSAWKKWMDEQVLTSIENHATDASDREFLHDWVDRAGMAIVKGYKRSTGN